MNADIGDPPVLDGRTGRVIDVDGEEAVLVEASPPELIEPELHDLLTALTRQDERIANLDRQRERTRDALKEAKSVREQIIEQIKKRNDGVLGLPFADAPGGYELDDEDAGSDAADDPMPL